VAAARKAFKNPDWRDMDTNARADLLYKFAQLIEEHRETLATIETWDNGKPYSVSLNDDLGEVISTIKYYAGVRNVYVRIACETNTDFVHIHLVREQDPRPGHRNLAG
jgi:acyl-CoA reductase-like NAD-dependent aldehyde dehydrogenase